MVLFAPGISAQKNKMGEMMSEYKEITILDNGVKRKRHIYQPEMASKMDAQSTDNNTTKSSSKRGIIVAFKNPQKVDLERFAATYGLKLKKKLITGYYIFENVSDQDDEVILAKILKEEKGLKTLKPNWTKNNRPR